MVNKMNISGRILPNLQIRKIENLPNNLQIFNCDYNKITKIQSLPDSLIVMEMK